MKRSAVPVRKAEGRRGRKHRVLPGARPHSALGPHRPGGQEARSHGAPAGRMENGLNCGGWGEGPDVGTPVREGLQPSAGERSKRLITAGQGRQREG